MKRARSVAILSVCVVSALLLSPVRPVDAAGDASKGKPLYEKHCMVCHGPQGKGDGPTGTLIKPPAANFTGEASKKKTEAELLGTMESGKPGTAMGPWKGLLSPSDLRDVLAYVMALRK
ncbi:MAG: cytochrome c [Nitrospira sp.]|nr:cytochrome c [Nitrospira sp.]